MMNILTTIHGSRIPADNHSEMRGREGILVIERFNAMIIQMRHPVGIMEVYMIYFTRMYGSQYLINSKLKPVYYSTRRLLPPLLRFF